jgi:DNA-binding PucR family transcriptional regulator
VIPPSETVGEARTSDRVWSDVVEALLAEVEQLSKLITDRIMDRLRSYRGRIAPADLLAEVTRNMEQALRSLSDRTASAESYDFSAWVTSGEDRAHRGITVSDLLQANFFAAQGVFTQARLVCGDQPGSDAVLLEILERLSAWHQVGSSQLAAGHGRAEVEAMRREHERRTRFVEGALLGSLTEVDLRLSAEAYALDPDASYYVLRGHLGSEIKLARLERAFRAFDSGGSRGGLLALIGDDAWGLLADKPTTDVGAPVGVSEPMPLNALAEAFREATRAMRTAIALGISGCHNLASFSLRSAVVSDQRVGEIIQARYIDPVVALGRQGQTILKTVEAYLENDRGLAATAEALLVHANTVRYRLSRFEELTGASFRETRSLAEIWWAVERHQIEPSEDPQS